MGHSIDDRVLGPAGALWRRIIPMAFTAAVANKKLSQRPASVSLLGLCYPSHSGVARWVIAYCKVIAGGGLCNARVVGIV
jgi:hypothetical protein